MKDRLIITLILLSFCGLLIYWHHFRVLFDVPGVLGKSIAEVERICGSPVNGVYKRPIDSAITFDSAGKATLIYIGPNSLAKAGVRFSQGKSLLRHFGFAILPKPDIDGPGLLRWNDVNGTAIQITHRGGDNGGDVGGDKEYRDRLCISPVMYFSPNLLYSSGRKKRQ
jgi:hypothetical protein